MTDIHDLVKQLRDPLEYLSPAIVGKGMKSADVIEAQAKRIEKLSEWEKEVKDTYFQLLKSMGFEHINQLIDGFEKKNTRIAELEAALKPFADLISSAPCSDGDTFIVGTPKAEDIRRAHSTLNKPE